LLGLDIHNLLEQPIEAFVYPEDLDRFHEHQCLLFESLANSLVDGVIVIDEKGNHIHQNHQFRKMWRIPDAVVAHSNDSEQDRYVAEQVKDPALFLSMIRESYSGPMSNQSRIDGPASENRTPGLRGRLSVPSTPRRIDEFSSRK